VFTFTVLLFLSLLAAITWFASRAIASRGCCFPVLSREEIEVLLTRAHDLLTAGSTDSQQRACDLEALLLLGYVLKQNSLSKAARDAIEEVKNEIEKQIDENAGRMLRFMWKCSLHEAKHSI
jgi:hypothetical protein